MKIDKELIAASTTPLILSVLLEGESYGYEIIKKVKEASDATIDWSEGMVYPALRRLEDQGLLEARWVTPDSGRRRRYYSLTPKGRKALAAERQAWLSVHCTLTRLWRPHPWPA